MRPLPRVLKPGRDVVVLVAGAICVNIALGQGLAVDFGWWGFLFWAGIGLICAALKYKAPAS